MIAIILFLLATMLNPASKVNAADTTYKSDANFLLAQIEEYAANHNGEYPSADAQGWSAFMETRSGGNSGTIKYKMPAFGPGTTTEGNMRYGLGARCNGDVMVSVDVKRSIAIQIGLTANKTYCAGDT